MRDKLKNIWLTDPEDIRKVRIRSLFLRYLIVIGIAEMVVLVLFWLFQVEEAGPDVIGVENIPFQWKAYFLISFLIPVIVTFVLGFTIELKKRYGRLEEEKADRIRKIVWPYGFPGKKRVFLWLVIASIFMISMLFVGFSEVATNSGCLYVSSGVIVIISALMAVGCFFWGISVMLKKYRSRVNTIKSEYRKAVSRHLGQRGAE